MDNIVKDAWDSSQWGTLKGKTIPLPIIPQAAGFQSPGVGWGSYNRVFAMPFDGEKDLGEMGPIRKYILDYPALRLRSWQLYLESDVCQALFRRSTMWAIGEEGLRLRSRPAMNILEKKGVTFEAEEFNEIVEENFKIFADTTNCDFVGQRNLAEIATEGWINKVVAGDVLIVLRLVNKRLP